MAPQSGANRRHKDAVMELLVGARAASDQLRARGSVRRAVRERKEELRRDKRGRCVADAGLTTFDRNRRELRRSGCKEDGSLTGAAIAEAAALLRLAIRRLVMMRMTGHRMDRGGAAMLRVQSDVVHRHVDRQAAVHGARVQLRRLRQTDGKPNGKDGGEATKEPMMAHANEYRRLTGPG